MNNLMAARFADTPVMVAHDRAGWMADCLSAVSAQTHNIQARQTAEPALMQDDFWPKEGSWMCTFRPYSVVADGTLLIPIKGMLLHDYGYQLFDWATGYTYIQKAFERGLADPMVKRIALVINSGGGEVAGNFDLVDTIYARRSDKPMISLVNEHAYSAAFSLATATGKVVVMRTGGVGSVGVVTSHLNASGAMEKMGYKIEFIHAGKHKVDGNPYEALPESVKNRMQARIDGLYSIFVSTVARNLGLEPQTVRDTEALTYSAQEALDLGFVHEIGSFDEALAAFSGDRINPVGEETMSLENQKPETAQADLDAARAEGRKEGATAERTRIQGILGCDESKNRRDLAFHLSMNTDLSVEAAKGILAAAPEVAENAVAAVPANGADFAAAMANGNPELGSEGAQSEQAGEADLMKQFRAANGLQEVK